MAIQSVEELVDKLQLCAPVRQRAMFGGYGLFVEGLMFGFVAEGQLYFKCDRHNLKQYHSAGCIPFTYERKGKPVQMSHYSLPDRVLNDLQKLEAWVGSAKLTAVRRK